MSANDILRDEPFCGVCHRRGEALHVVKPERVCSTCAVQIGRFILRKPPGVLAEMWQVSASGADSNRRNEPAQEALHNGTLQTEALKIVFDRRLARTVLAYRLSDRIFET